MGICTFFVIKHQVSTGRGIWFRFASHETSPDSFPGNGQTKPRLRKGVLGMAVLPPDLPAIECKIQNAYDYSSTYKNHR
jgi:hypothetical protein